MENIIILLACVVMTTAAGNYKLFKMEKTEKIEVREFEMGTKELDKTLSRKLYETRGNFTNCDDTKTKFSVQWSPLTLNTQGVATFYLDFVTPNEFDKGNVQLAIFYPQFPDIPIISMEQPVSCDDIKRAMPYLVCPIKANAELKGTLTVSDLTYLPIGNYIIVMKLTRNHSQGNGLGRISGERRPC